MQPAIYQIVAGFRSGDAISQAALLMRAVFRGWGLRSEILCEARAIAPEALHEVLPFQEVKFARNDVVILHLSIGCEANLFFQKIDAKKVIVYHNITPAHYFELLNPQLAASLREGRRHLEMLATSAMLNLAVSKFNAEELRLAGYNNPQVFPLPIDVSSMLRGDVDASTYKELNSGHLNLLFVGRFVPNKKIEDLVTVMHYLTKIVPNVRLVHVGATGGAEAYYGLTQAVGKVLSLQNLKFMKSVPQNVLNACYKSAHAFLCLSEHEGFCAPLVEAMLNRIPVLAVANAAIPETMGGAGVLFSSPPNFLEIAETVSRVLTDKELAQKIVERQDKRIEAFAKRDLAAELKALLSPLM